MIRHVAFMIVFFGNLYHMTMPILQSGVPAFIPMVKSGLAWISQPSDHCMHRSQPFILFQLNFFLFFRIHSVVSLFSESNFLSAPDPQGILEIQGTNAVCFLHATTGGLFYCLINGEQSDDRLVFTCLFNQQQSMICNQFRLDSMSVLILSISVKTFSCISKCWRLLFPCVSRMRPHTNV